MEIFANIGLGMIGFLIGNLLFAKVGSWIATIHEMAKDRAGEGSKGARLASATLLGAGPWFLIATGIFAYYVHSESWATPILVGAVIAIAFFTAIAVYLARKAARKGENAA